MTNERINSGQISLFLSRVTPPAAVATHQTTTHRLAPPPETYRFRRLSHPAADHHHQGPLRYKNKRGARIIIVGDVTTAAAW